MSWTGKKQVDSETFLARVKRRTTHVTNQTLILLILALGSAHLKIDWDVIGLNIYVFIRPQLWRVETSLHFILLFIMIIMFFKKNWSSKSGLRNFNLKAI